MLEHLPHLLWLLGSAAIAVRLSLPPTPSQPGGGTPTGLRAAAGAVLAILVVDGALLFQDLPLLDAVAALAGGGLALAAVGRRGDAAPSVAYASPPAAARPAPAPLADAVARWNEPAALADGDGRLVWANAAWAAHHAVEDPVGRSWDDFHDAKENPRWRHLLAEATRHGAAAGLLDHRPATGSGPDPAEAWTSRAHVITLDGHVFMAAVRLPSGEMSLRRQVREIGHGLNNVLSAVVGNVGLAIETPGLDPTIRDDLKEAEEGGLRAAELVHGLQALARDDL